MLGLGYLGSDVKGTALCIGMTNMCAYEGDCI